MASTSNMRLTVEPHNNTTSEFIQFTATMRLPMAPVWARDHTGKEGVTEVLAGWVMRYLPPIRGVLLSFGATPKFLHPTDTFPVTLSPYSEQDDPRTRTLLESPEPQDDDEQDEGDDDRKTELMALPMIEGSGFSLPYVKWRGLAWRPCIGQKIVGSPSLSTPSHISLLLHNLFNASIPASHIPSSEYFFDPDFPVPEAIQNRQKLSWPEVSKVEGEEGAEVEKENDDVEEEEEEEEEEDKEYDAQVKAQEEEEAEEEQYRESGWWRHRITNEPLGGIEGRIEFTIVGLTIANSMISVTGSLLPDPFAPEAAHPKRAASAVPATRKRRRANTGDSSGSSDSSRSPSPSAPPKVRSGENVENHVKDEVHVDSLIAKGDEKKVKEKEKEKKKEKKVKKEKKDKTVTRARMEVDA